MKHFKLLINLALLAVVMIAQFAVATAARARRATPTKFTVRVENISNPEGYAASNGERWPFALSPGMFVLNSRKSMLFTEGKPASMGLESQAEDGDPTGLINSLVSMHHAANLHGVFNTPVGADKPGPIGPGGEYEFSFTANPGMRLSVITMFGQSNDWFYAPKRQGIDLFVNGKPLNGDITSEFMLFDAGTEVNEEPGVKLSLCVFGGVLLFMGTRQVLQAI